MTIVNWMVNQLLISLSAAWWVKTGQKEDGERGKKDLRKEKKETKTRKNREEKLSERVYFICLKNYMLMVFMVAWQIMALSEF